MQHQTPNGLRLAACLHMRHSTALTCEALRRLAGDIRTESGEIMAHWGAPMNAAFAAAAVAQQQRNGPAAAAAMMHVFHMVHTFMLRANPRLDTSDGYFRRRRERLRRACKRLSMGMRAAVVSLGCIRSNRPRPIPTRVDELDVIVTDADVAPGPTPDAMIPLTPAQQRDRSFVSRMADLLKENAKRSVTVDEKRRAVTVCRRQHADANAKIGDWEAIAHNAERAATQLETLAAATVELVHKTRRVEAYQNRANVMY